MFQTFNLLPRYTALENVTLPLIYAGVPKVEREKLAIETLEQVGLGDRMTHKPNELSGGQRQRVAIARAMVNKPSIILADEPTGNLDSKSGQQIFDILKELNQKDGLTIVLTTHNNKLGLQAKRIIYLKDGSIVSREESSLFV